jgi:hypothetical protein
MYAQNGITLVDDFFYIDGTGAPVTGKTNSSFTVNISKNGVGNQATTGVAIAEVDATNNPGQYSVTYNGVSSFAANVGEYVVRIRDTSAISNTWSNTYRLTVDGSAGGGTGIASFTATAANGRIYDTVAAAPVSGASVRIYVPSSGIILATLTSDASGLWGPVYLNNGTYAISVQKSGYTVSTTGTIVVAANVATGPGADLNITTAGSSSGALLSDLQAYARRQYRDRTGTKSDAEILQSINDALDMISQSRIWDWYQEPLDLSLQQNFSTGTITFTQGSTACTIAGSTWPSWAASGEIYSNGQYHRIASRDSTTQVTLTIAWAEATATFTVNNWQLFQDNYALPANCQRFGRLLYGTQWVWGGEPVGWEQYLDSKNRFLYGQQGPRVWAIRKQNIYLWPYPSITRLVNGWYYRKPAALVNPSDQADWDPMHLFLLHRAIDYQLSLRGDCMAGNPSETMGEFRKALTDAVSNDKSPLVHPSPMSGNGWPNTMDSQRIPAS